MMAELHTVDFLRGSVTLVSDAERGTITLQFDRTVEGDEPIRRIWKALRRRYGGSVASRVRRWRSGEANELRLPSGGKPHPEYPEIVRFEIGLNPKARMDAVLADLLGSLRHLPGYRRTYGAPLDSDLTLAPSLPPDREETSQRATSVLKRILDLRDRNRGTAG